MKKCFIPECTFSKEEINRKYPRTDNNNTNPFKATHCCRSVVLYEKPTHQFLGEKSWKSPL